MNNLSSCVLSCTVLAVLLSGCARRAPDDAALTSDIKARLEAEADLKPLNLNVQVTNGVATLSGAVPSTGQELKAYKLATQTTGISRVEDKMQVQAAQSGAPPNANAMAPGATPAEPEIPPVEKPSPTKGEKSAPTEPERSARGAESQRTATPVQPAMVAIPSGTQVSVRMTDSIDSKVNQTGQEFRGVLAEPIVVHGSTAVPAGADVFVRLANAKSAGRIRGSSELELQLARLVYHGKTYPLTSNAYTAQGKGRGKQTAVRAGIGAAAGSIIGAIAGGGKGAAIGAAVGGGGAAGYQLLTHGQQVKIPAETIVNFSLQAPLEVQRGPTRRIRSSEENG